MNRIKSLWTIPILVACLAKPVLSGNPDNGDLDKFEKAATTEKSTSHTHSDSNEGSDCDSEDDAYLDLFIGTVGGAVLGGVGSWARMEGISDPDLSAYFSRRRLGEPVIPILGLYVSYQDADGDIGALHFRGEIGYGPFGLSAERTRYSERLPGDAMEFTRIHGLYRMSISNSVELDAGFGSATLVGNKRHTGFSFTLPLRAHAAAFPVGWEFRPTWSWLGGPAVSEYVFSMVFRASAVSLRAGYRITSVEGESLNGPLIGLSAQL